MVRDGDSGIVRKGHGEVAFVAFVPRKAMDGVVERVAHLVGMLDGKAHLLFQARGPAVPEQQRAEGHVPQRRRVPHQPLAGDALAAGFAVAERELGVVAGGAGDGAGRGQLLVLEQALAQGDLGRRRRIVGGTRDEDGPRELGLQGSERVGGLLGERAVGRASTAPGPPSQSRRRDHQQRPRRLPRALDAERPEPINTSRCAARCRR